MAEARAGRDIAFASDGEQARGYLVVPPSGHGPGVVVIQEWWGLVDHIRDVCDRLAREGFVALAPDLYRGGSTTDPDEAGSLMMDLDIPRAARDLDAAVTALLNRNVVDGSRVGCIGFCMGGQLALFAATRNAKIAAVVDCYGIHPKVTLDLSGLAASVLGVFAESDDFIPAEAVRKLESDLRSAGKRVTVKIQRGAQHAFMNETRPDVYDARAAADAWSDILSFLHAELG